MKILHVLQNYYPSFGGTQYLFQKISEKLVSDYCDDVTVYTTNSMIGPNNSMFVPIKLLSEKINGVEIKRFKFRRWHKKPIKFLLKVNKYLKLSFIEKLGMVKIGPWSKSLNNAIQTFEGDVICGSSSYNLYMNYPLISQKLFRKVPFVFMGALHFDDVLNITIPSKTYKAIEASNAYIANTEYEKYCLIKLGINSKKIFVVGCGVSLDEFIPDPSYNFHKNYSLDADAPVIGYIGRHTQSKGIDTLINAMTIVWGAFPNARLLIAGAETNYSYEIQQRIQQLHKPFRNKIIYIANINNKLKCDLFNACDIIVNASKSESFGIVYLEAWACKKPVIGCNIEAVKSLITAGLDGLLIDPDNYQQLAEYLQTLLLDSDMRTQMGEAGYRKIKKLYTWEIITQKYRSVYQYAINSSLKELSGEKNASV